MHSVKVGEEGVSSADDRRGGVVERVDCGDCEVGGAEEDDAGVVEDGDCGGAVDGELGEDGVEDEEHGCCGGGGEVLWAEAVEEQEEEEGRELEEGRWGKGERSHGDGDVFALWC